MIDYSNFYEKLTGEVEFDFELYYPKGRNSVSLPALSIRNLGPQPLCSDCPLPRLYTYEIDFSIKHKRKRKHKPYRFFAPPTGLFTRIVGYGIINKHTFVVQTDLLQHFSLNLDSPSEGWRFYESGWLVNCEAQFFGIGNKLCVDVWGVSDMSFQDRDTILKIWLNSVGKNHWIQDFSCKKCAHYALSFVRNELARKICLHEACYRDELGLTCLDDDDDHSTPIACHVVLASDDEEHLQQMTVHQFELDVSKFPATTAESKFLLKGCPNQIDWEEESAPRIPWAKCVGSLRFGLKDEYKLPSLTVFPIQVASFE